jgi:hypothetical protein
MVRSTIVWLAGMLVLALALFLRMLAIASHRPHPFPRQGSTEAHLRYRDLFQLRERLGKSARLTPGKCEALWTALADEDAAKAYEAIWTFIVTPESAVPFLERRLRPAASVDVAQISRWIADLENERFSVREQAPIANRLRYPAEVVDKVRDVIHRSKGRKVGYRELRGKTIPRVITFRSDVPPSKWDFPCYPQRAGLMSKPALSPFANCHSGETVS